MGIGKWLTLKEAASLAGVKENTFYAYINRGQVIPQKALQKIGSQWLIDKTWVIKKYGDKNKEKENEK